VSAGQVVLVTGAGRGIGAAIATRFAEPGVTVAVTQRKVDGLAATAAAIRERGGEALCFGCDARDRAATGAMVDELLAARGRIDVLVNNAGTIVRQSLAETTEESWDAVFDTNVKGTLWTSQAVAASMVQRGEGAIVNVSSVAGTLANAERGAYCASKGAVDLLTKVMALELGPHGVRVNAVAPGFIRTELNDVELTEGGLEPAFVERIAAGRIGGVEEVAGAVELLASEAAAYVNGEVLVVDGGWSIAQNFPRAASA
jgi:NAD(P)-dependent dehydrogenase (short-subunit alcohol dehydrogenase family)